MAFAVVAVLIAIPLHAQRSITEVYSAAEIEAALRGYEPGRLIHLPGDEEPHRVAVKMPAGALSILSDYHAKYGVNGKSRADVIWGDGVLAAARPLHLGIDIEAPHGYPVIAAADGVAEVSEGRLGGKIVVLVHEQGSRSYRSLYAHLDTIFVGTDERVERGQLLGTAGNTGIGAGEIPHLHFEAGNCCEVINPHLRWFDGLGEITLFEPERDFEGKPLKLTYPLPGVGDWYRYFSNAEQQSGLESSR